MKVQNPIIGRARGSAGGMTFCKNYDKNVARAKAFEVSNPKTQAQQTQRAFFAELTALCSDFSDELLRTLFPKKPKTMSRRNALCKQIAECYDFDGYIKAIDYGKIDTLGNASVMDLGITTCSIDDDVLIANIDEELIGNPVVMENYFFIAFVNETKNEIIVPLMFAKVYDDDYATLVPAGWLSTNVIHAIPFITDAKVRPTVFGNIKVWKRPAHSNN